MDLNIVLGGLDKGLSKGRVFQVMFYTSSSVLFSHFTLKTHYWRVHNIISDINCIFI